jgi:hypothetical protein
MLLLRTLEERRVGHMPVDPHRITEVARRLLTRLEATYGDVPDAELEGVLIVAAVKRGDSGRHVVHFDTSEMPAYAARGLLTEVDDHLGGNLPGARD